MEDTTFDTLARSVAQEVLTRRSLLHLLLGGALGAVAPHLGWADQTEAKAARHTRIANRTHEQNTRHSQQKHAPERSQASGEVHGEGRGSNKGKGKGKGHNKPPKEPTPDPGCGSGERQCYGDNTCVAADACCPAERRCAGGSCVPGDSCCPEQKRCGDGSCITQNECCPDAVPPLCGGCEEVVCENGEQHCRYQQGCCPNVISMHCPSVPASMWPTRDGEEIPLPGGCCPLTNYLETPQHTYCAPPHGAGDYYRC